MSLSTYKGITPSGYRILILPDKVPEEITEGGIVIPVTEIEKYQVAQPTGRIVAVGPDAWADKPKPWAFPGDRVVFNHYAGMLLSDAEGNEYRMCNDVEVLAVIDDSIKLGELTRRTRYGG